MATCIAPVFRSIARCSHIPRTEQAHPSWLHDTAGKSPDPAPRAESGLGQAVNFGLVWASQFGYEPGRVLLVLASHPYDPADYIREYETFLEVAAAGSAGFASSPKLSG